MMWQPIETAHKDGTHIILYARHSHMPYGQMIVLSGCYKNGWWEDCPGNASPLEATHWMPLPEAPL